MRLNFIIILLLLLSGCRNIDVNKEANKLKTRIPAPEGYEWMEENISSFGAYLQKAPVKKDGSKILDYKGSPILNQYNHIAILDYDIGTKDLQQCADVVIRLHAEYLYDQKRYNEIQYHFTSGDLYKWNDYKIGIRPKVHSNNKVEFLKTAQPNDTYAGFRKYLDIVFMYAGTISLNAESTKITDNKKIKAGDFLVTPGSPGHAVFIAGRAKNKNGDIVYLLGEGYTPAQSIHILTNPFNKKISPWYTLDTKQKSTTTARYKFKKTNIRSYNN